MENPFLLYLNLPGYFIGDKDRQSSIYDSWNFLLLFGDFERRLKAGKIGNCRVNYPLPEAVIYAVYGSYKPLPTDFFRK